MLCDIEEEALADRPGSSCRGRSANASSSRAIVREHFGELIQIDGSDHRWFEDRAAPCTLLVFIDDATSRLMQRRFVPSESTFAYFETGANRTSTGRKNWREGIQPLTGGPVPTRKGETAAVRASFSALVLRFQSCAASHSAEHFGNELGSF
jgi:hypothetical protein